MPTASNMKELRAMILDRMASAMQEVAETAKADMQEATDYFYAGGSPTMYERTGTLGNSPTTDGPIRIADGYRVDAYLNDKQSYLSGSKPTLGQVLMLADQGVPFITKNGAEARPTVGNRHFWDKAKKEMHNSLRKTLKAYFK